MTQNAIWVNLRAGVRVLKDACQGEVLWRQNQCTKTGTLDVRRQELSMDLQTNNPLKST